MDSLNAAIVVYFFGFLVVNGCDWLKDALSVSCKIFHDCFEAVRNTICPLDALDEIRRMTIAERIQFLKLCVGAQHVLDQGSLTSI